MAPRPKPATILMRQGTYRPGRHGVTPLAVGELVKPTGLDGDAGKLWDKVYDFACAAGAGECDIDAMAGMCRWYAEYRRCEAVLAGLAPSADNYRRIQMVTANAWRCYTNMAARFGLTPSDRMRLKESAETTPSTIDAMFRQRLIPTKPKTKRKRR